MRRRSDPRALRDAFCQHGSMSAPLVSERVGQFFVDADRLEYTEFGAGDRWVVLLHGQLMPRRMHDPLARALAAEGFHVVTLDLLGHGRSDRPVDPKEYSMTALGSRWSRCSTTSAPTRRSSGARRWARTSASRSADAGTGAGAGLLLEMPVLDNALEAGHHRVRAAAVPGPVLPARHPAGRRRPRGWCPAGSCRSGPASSSTRSTSGRRRWRPRSTASSSAGSRRPAGAAGRSRPRRWSIGHPRDPIHLAADALMLAEEMPNARFVGARSILEWRAPPRPARTRGRRLRHRGCADRAARRPQVRQRLSGSGRHPFGTGRGQNGRVPYYRDEAIVLRTQKLGEADRIITLLTRSHGRVRAVAKGVRRTTSRFGSRLEPFSHVDLQLAEAPLARRRHPGRDAAARTRAGMGADYAPYTAGTVMLETAERLVVEDKEPALQQYLLLVGALRAICETGRPPRQVLDSFLLRSLAVAGYAPSFDACARCGVEGPHLAFNPSAGGMLCADCRAARLGAARRPRRSAALGGAAVRRLGRRGRAPASRHLREASRLVAAYLAWHLERGLKSLTPPAAG